MTWVNGWPIIGKVGQDGIGTMVWSGHMPIANTPIVVPQTDDDFNGPNLGVQWEWNYQPRAGKWSLNERPGFLRLHAFKPLQRDNLKKAGDTLTQRVFRSRTNVVTLALDLTGMTNGQVAGLCHYSSGYSFIGVRCEHGIVAIESAHNRDITNGPALTTRKLWLRSTWGLAGKSHYSYSTNGTSFTPFGKMYQLGWAIIVGIGLASLPTTTTRTRGMWIAIHLSIIMIRRPHAFVPRKPRPNNFYDTTPHLFITHCQHHRHQLIAALGQPVRARAIKQIL